MEVVKNEEAMPKTDDNKDLCDKVSALLLNKITTNLICELHKSKVGAICGDPKCLEVTLLCIKCATDKNSCIKRLKHPLVDLDEYLETFGAKLISDFYFVKDDIQTGLLKDKIGVVSQNFLNYAFPSFEAKVLSNVECLEKEKIVSIENKLLILFQQYTDLKEEFTKISEFLPDKSSDLCVEKIVTAFKDQLLETRKHSLYKTKNSEDHHPISKANSFLKFFKEVLKVSESSSDFSLINKVNKFESLKAYFKNLKTKLNIPELVTQEENKEFSTIISTSYSNIYTQLYDETILQNKKQPVEAVKEAVKLENPSENMLIENPIEDIGVVCTEVYFGLAFSNTLFHVFKDLDNNWNLIYSKKNYEAFLVKLDQNAFDAIKNKKLPAVESKIQINEHIVSIRSYVSQESKECYIICLTKSSTIFIFDHCNNYSLKSSFPIYQKSVTLNLNSKSKIILDNGFNIFYDKATNKPVLIAMGKANQLATYDLSTGKKIDQLGQNYKSSFNVYKFTHGHGHEYHEYLVNLWRKRVYVHDFTTGVLISEYKFDNSSFSMSLIIKVVDNETYFIISTFLGDIYIYKFGSYALVGKLNKQTECDKINCIVEVNNKYIAVGGSGVIKFIDISDLKNPKIVYVYKNEGNSVISQFETGGQMYFLVVSVRDKSGGGGANSASANEKIIKLLKLNLK